MRLIDADALTKSITDWYCDPERCNSYNGVMCRACHVDDALSAIDQAPTVNEWISVKDRPPERPSAVDGVLVRREWYLVALESGTVMSLRYEFDDEQWAPVGSPVTHWMPLHAPPKEGEANGQQ